MNRKGQALVEFILVLPVLLIIIIALVDVGNIYIKKYELNKDLEIVKEFKEKNEEQKLLEYVTNEDIEYEESTEGELKILTLKKKVKVGAPILSKIIGNNYKVEARTPILEDSHG